MSTVETEVMERRRKAHHYLSTGCLANSSATTTGMGWVTYSVDRPSSVKVDASHYGGRAYGLYVPNLVHSGSDWPTKPTSMRGHVVMVAVGQQPESRAPFADFVAVKSKAAKSIIDYWLSVKNANPAIAQRLNELVEMTEEEYPDADFPSQHVLENVFKFFRAAPNLRRPLIGFTPSASVWLEWRVDTVRSAALEFRSVGSVNLAAFVPDPNDAFIAASFANSYSWKTAVAQINSNPALKWMHAG